MEPLEPFKNRLRRAIAGARPAELTPHLVERGDHLRRDTADRSGSARLRRVTASGVQSSWISSTTIAPPAIRLTIAYMSTRREPLAEAIGHRRQLVEHDHRLAVQRRLHRRGARRRDHGIARVQHIVGLHVGDAQRDAASGRTARTIRRRDSARARPRTAGPGTCAAIAGTACAITGASRSSSFVRLPGSSASTGFAGSRCSFFRNASRDSARLREIDQRMADEPHVDPLALVDRFLERERSAARDRRCASSA